MVGTIGLLVFLASWFYTAFLHTGPMATGGGHGGQVAGRRQRAGRLDGQVPGTLVFFLLAVFSFLFTFAIDPRSLPETVWYL